MRRPRRSPPVSPEAETLIEDKLGALVEARQENAKLREQLARAAQDRGVIPSATRRRR
ncbi:hypothetical protein ACWENQ_45560 [Nonomuraea sp. NPDC004354]